MTGGWSFAIIMWLFVVFVSAGIPLQSGIVLHSLAPELKADGYSFEHFLVNLTGKFPSAYVYGIIDENTSINKLAMAVCLGYVFVSSILTLIAYCCKPDVEQKIEELQDPIKEVENDNKDQKE